MTRVAALCGTACIAVAVASQPTGAQGGDRREPERLRFGISVLLDDQVSLVRGRRVVLVTDAGARDERGRPVEDLLRTDRRARTARLVVVGTWRADNIPGGLAARWGSGTRADSIRLANLARSMDSVVSVAQTVIVDLSDDGVRTGAAPWVVLAALRAASQHHVQLVLLDRPNPLTGERTESPVADASSGASDALYGLPARHGMTLGEIARWFNASGAIGAALTVVPARGWRRSWWPPGRDVRLRRGDGTERSPEQLVMLGAFAPLAATNLLVEPGPGRTTVRVGAPWLNAKAVAGLLSDRLMAGVKFRIARDEFSGGSADGAIPALVVDVTDRDQASGLRVLGSLLWAIRRLHGDALTVDAGSFDRLAGSGAVRRSLMADEDPDSAADRELPGVVDFRRRVREVLLYR